MNPDLLNHLPNILSLRTLEGLSRIFQKSFHYLKEISTGMVPELFMVMTTSLLAQCWAYGDSTITSTEQRLYEKTGLTLENFK